MASEALAIARPEPPGRGRLPRFMRATFEASARGRAFLSEYARRNRSADTEVLLAAIDRLTAQIRGDAEALQLCVRNDCACWSSPSGSLARISTPRAAAGQGDDARRIGRSCGTAHRCPDRRRQPDRRRHEPARPQLAVVPASDEPELPIRSPDAQAPAMAVVAPAKPVAASDARGERARIQARRQPAHQSAAGHLVPTGGVCWRRSWR